MYTYALSCREKEIGDPHVLARRFFAGGQRRADVESLAFPRLIRDVRLKHYGAHCTRDRL